MKIGDYRETFLDHGILGSIGYTIAAFGRTFGGIMEYHEEERNFEQINVGILELYLHIEKGFDSNCDIIYTPSIYKDSVEYLQYRADSIIGGLNEDDNEYLSSYRCLLIALEDICTIGHF